MKLKKMLLVTTSLNVASVFLFALVSSISLAILIVSISFFGMFLGLSLPLQTTLLAIEIPLYRATSTGVYNFFRYVWMTIGPIVGTSFYWFGYELEFFTFGIIFSITLLFIVSFILRAVKEEKSCKM